VTKKLLIGAGALLAILLATALVAPSLIDWNAYRPQLVAAVKEATGRDLAVDGGVRLALLPAPELSAKELRLSSVPGAAEPDMARLKELEVRVALLPLLSGTIKVESVRLIEPTIVLEELKDGRNNWTFAPSAKPAGGAAPGQDGGDGRGFALSLDDVRVKDATVIYRSARTGAEERVDGLSFEGSAGSLQGPFALTGELQLAATPLSFEAQIGTLQDGRPAPLRLVVKSAERGATAEFGGSLARAGTDLRVAGKLKAQADDLAKAVGAASPLLARPLALETAIDASAESAAANDLNIRFGDIQAGGAVSMAFAGAPRFDATLHVTRLDLDALLAAADAGGQAAKPAAAAGAKPADASFGIPLDLSGAVSATVDGVVYRGQVIRQAQLNAEVGGGKVTLKRLAALLPGGSDAALSGSLAAPQGRPQFDGRLELASDNLRGLLGWLKLEPSGGPLDRLNAASLTAALRVSPELAELANVNLRLDGSTIVGGAAMRLQQRPSFAVDLTVDRLNLDGYLADDGAKPRAGAAAAQAKPQPAGAAGGLAALNDFDANVKLKAGQLTYNRAPLKNVTLDATLAGGRLTVREARAQDGGGATLTASGTASEFATAPKFKADLALAADDLSGLAQLAGARTAGAAAKAGRTDLKAKVEGGLDEVAFDLEGALAGGRLKSQGRATGLRGAPAFDATLNAEHKDLTALVRNFGVDWRPAAQNLGGLSLDVAAKGSVAALDLPSIRVKAGPAEVEGAGRLELGGPRPYLNAKLQASEILADPFLPAAGRATPAASGGGTAPASARAGEPRWSREPLDLSALEALDADVTLAARSLTFKDYPFKEPRLTLALKDGVLRIGELTGKLFEGAVALTGELGGKPQPSLSLDVKLDEADVQQALTTAMGMDKVSGRLDFAGRFRAAGRSEHDLVSHLDGDARLSMGEGVLRGVDLASLSRRLGELNGAVAFLDLAARSFSGGETRIRSASGTWQVRNGVAVTRDTKAVLEAAEATLVGEVQLPAWRMDLQSEIALVEHPKAPPIAIALRGPLDAPQRDVKTQAMEQYLASRVGSELLRKGLGDKAGPLGAILGGGRQPQPQPPSGQAAPAQPQQQQPAAPPAQQAIEGLLKGLLKK